MNSGHNSAMNTTNGTPNRRIRSAANRPGPLRAMAGPANSPARKKNVPITKSADGPSTAASSSSDRGWKVTSLTSSYGQPPIAE
jgi:hypothetical protein